MKQGYHPAALLGFCLLSACGGGGSASSDPPASTSSYTIGGTVSQLSASGLVLLENGSNALTVTADSTSFVFPTLVSAGTAYAVTIQSQPSGETCIVSNGSGMASANVTSVGVSCSAATDTIGGAIAGLTASGLVLLDNGGNALTVSANSTSFTFSTPLTSGAAYSVTVQTQPTGETCSISNGSGTASANVTNVSAVCSAVTYTVGGSISALSASGLVLLDNGGNALTVSANSSSFTFSTPLASGAPYSVTVQTQPTGETCSISNGSGMAGANVTSVSVACTAVATYTIGGSISGLNASGLVLLDNGGNALALAANSISFVFSTPVNAGSTYAVTVHTQPTAETCTVSSGSGSASANVTGISVSCVDAFASGGSNVVQMTVAAGPASAGNQTFNIPYVSVTVCQPGSSRCVTIPDVLVDSGSSGLRIMASLLASAGVTLTPIADPAHSGNTIQECLPFADGYAWGAVATATVSVGGETSSSAIPVQVIDDNSSGPAAPSSCMTNGASLDSINAFDANGVIGVSVFNQDCGAGCIGAPNAGNDVYFSCPNSGGGNCESTDQALVDQVANPVASFPTDNNGVILQLPSISAAGATSASGYLVFGIGTESNNGLGGATILTANDEGNITTTFNAQALGSSFIDSGSNTLYFNDSALATCGNSGSEADFYCPTTTASLSAVNQGANGNTSSVSFQVANLNNISDRDFAINDAGGPAFSIANFGPYFDWGLPFFYGRTVFVTIAGKTAAGTSGPYYAY